MPFDYDEVLEKVNECKYFNEYHCNLFKYHLENPMDKLAHCLNCDISQ